MEEFKLFNRPFANGCFCSRSVFFPDFLLIGKFTGSSIERNIYQNKFKKKTWKKSVRELLKNWVQNIACWQSFQIKLLVGARFCSSVKILIFKSKTNNFAPNIPTKGFKYKNSLKMTWDLGSYKIVICEFFLFSKISILNANKSTISFWCVHIFWRNLLH